MPSAELRESRGHLGSERVVDDEGSHGIVPEGHTDRQRLVPEEDEPEAPAPRGPPRHRGDTQADTRALPVLRWPLSHTKWVAVAHPGTHGWTDGYGREAWEQHAACVVIVSDGVLCGAKGVKEMCRLLDLGWSTSMVHVWDLGVDEVLNTLRVGVDHGCFDSA